MSITKTPASMVDPSGATNGQVLTFNGSTSAWGASSLSANGFSVLLSSNGYQKLPSGLIMQWGLLSSVLLDNTTWNLINLPITFPNQILNASATISYDEYVNGSIGTVIKGLSASGFYVMGDNSNDTKIANIYWQAIGY